jgi:hypothetical protein
VTARRLALAALASLGLAACGKHGRAADARAVTGLQAVPSGVVAVVGIDVGRLAGSQVVARAVDQLLARRPELGQRLDALEASCHLDLANKVKRVILASGPRDKDGTTPVLLVASGQIAEADLTSCLERSVGSGGGKLSASSADGRTIYKIEEGRRQVYYAFGAADTVVLSNMEPWVEKALGAGPKVMDDKDMKAWIGMSDQAAPMWLAAKVDPKVGDGLIRVGQGQIKAGPKAVFGSMDPSAGLKAELGAVMQTEDDAKALESFSKSQVGLLALAAQWKGLGPAVSKTAVTRDSAVVRLRLSLSDAEVRDVFSKIDTTAAAPQDAHP